MSLLVSDADLIARRAIVRGPLSALANGLREELSPLIRHPVDVPAAKALLSRRGGRCEVDGTYLAFEPFNARHFCATCGREYRGELHDRFRLYWYQLWLAERTLHASLLGVLVDDQAAKDLAANLLGQYAEQYLRYPNADNVLGPSRPFFSTYLESIWLLQLTIALSVLESAPAHVDASFGARVRDRLIAPSAALIASYDEGMSNRQVWNNAALMAAGRLLDDRDMFERAIHGRSGLHAHLASALLDDGTWYEGENYHLFAHRGLWYGERLASRGGDPLGAPLERRYREAFAAPFRTILPDLTYPSRRDSQYAVSIRQLRFAESCELGLAYGDDDRLIGVLARLYDPAVPRGDTGRRATSADVERNLPATGLERSDLSWRTLLCARAELPPLTPVPLTSDLLPAQGVGIIRRAGGRLYVSLDYGHSGGGHGHSDRLNLTLMNGDQRWFDDPGTGSYVDPTLHWYRSTLAHNAPLVGGRSQPRVSGTLESFEDDGVTGRIAARAALAPGLVVSRTIVVQHDHLVDILQWVSGEPHVITLPMHGVVPNGESVVEPEVVLGADGIEDGFGFLEGVARVDLPEGRMTFGACAPSGDTLAGWSFASGNATLWTATAPAPPNKVGRRPLALLTHESPTGAFVSVWSWNGAIADVTMRADGGAICVARSDGSMVVHAWPSLALSGAAERTPQVDEREPANDEPRTTGQSSNIGRETENVSGDACPAHFVLGEQHYRQSELSWSDAGEPRAIIRITLPAAGMALVEVDVVGSQRRFISPAQENELDNEPMPINGDSVQLYAIAATGRAGLLLVPDGDAVAALPIDGWTNDLPVSATWEATDHGYRLTATIEVGTDASELSLDVLVNRIAPGRARRVGQLVLSGAAGEFVYLRGDRHDPSRLLRFILRP